MTTFKKIAVLFFLAVTFVPYTAWTGEFAGLEEGIEGNVSKGVDSALEESLSGDLSGSERQLTEEEVTHLNTQITQALESLQVKGETIAAEDVAAIAKRTTESILNNMKKGDNFAESFGTQTEQSALENTINDAQVFFKQNPEDLAAYQSDIEKAGADDEEAFEEPEASALTEQQQQEVIAADLVAGSADTATTEAVKNSVEGVNPDAANQNKDGGNGEPQTPEAVTQEQPFKEESGWWKRTFVDSPKKFVVDKYTTLTGTVDNVRKQLSAADGALGDQLAVREDFILERINRGVVDAADGSSMKVMKATGYDGTVARMPKGTGTLETTFNPKTGEYTVTRSDGATVNMSAEKNPILKSVTDPEGVKFQVDADGNLQWRFDSTDESLFSIKSVEGIDGEVTQVTKSFDNLSNDVNKTVVQEQRTAIKAAQEQIEKTWTKTKIVAEAGAKQVWRGAKWVGGKLTGLVSTVLHGLGQAVIFTVPNILEQNRVQAAQAAEQYAMLTSVQQFGNLTLQIPAFLIPKGSPMNGLFIYKAVSADASESANNFDTGTLLDGDYYVSIADQYTPWGSSYIPQTGKLIHLNTGFTFDASGGVSTDAISLVADKDSSAEGNVGAGPVAKYLATILGKGVGGTAEGESHVSSWKDWLPFGNVKTETATVTSNKALSFLFDNQGTLPPAMINKALAQFLQPMRAGSGACTMTANGSSGDAKTVYSTCMKTGFNSTISIQQVMGIGFGAAVLQTLIDRGSGDAAQLTNTKTQLQDFLVAQQSLVSGILSGDKSSKTSQGMDDANARQTMLQQKMDALTDANDALKGNYGSQGVSPELFINAMGIYVYETVPKFIGTNLQDTPIAQFMHKHSPLGTMPVGAGLTSSAAPSILKDYVVLLDNNYNIVSAYNAEITDDGKFKYVPNDAVVNVCSLVSGRTYALGGGAGLIPVSNSSGITGIASQVWATLTNQLKGFDQSNKTTNGTGSALLHQIAVMADYATNLIVEGPYIKNGFTFEKVNLELVQGNEEEAITLTFDQLASGATVASTKTVQPVPFTVKQKFVGSEDNGILLYRAIGALGVDAQGNPIDDYVIALGEAQVTTSNGGTRSAFVILPLATDAFPNEQSSGSGITALVSLITGKVFTSDYIPQPPTRRMNVLMRNNNMSLISDPNSSVTVGGTAVGTVNLPMATAYMPTDLNPYNMVPKSQSDYVTMLQLNNALVTATNAYTALPSTTPNLSKTPQAQAVLTAQANLSAFNQKIANGTIPVEARAEGNSIGDLLYVEPMYWAMYQGYNICTNATLGAGQSSDTNLAWVTGTACPANSQLEIANNNAAASLISVLPAATVATLNDSFNRWFSTAITSGPEVQFEEGPFNIVPGLYLTLSANNAKNGNYFYQALPSFDSQDLMVVAQLNNSTIKPSYEVSDFSTIGGSFTSITNPVLIDIKNGYVFIPTAPVSGCTMQPSFLCNFAMVNGTLPRIFDVASIIEKALAAQKTSLAQLENSNPALANSLQYVIYQNDVRFQQLLTENYFAGKQLLLNPDAISSYIYAVATVASGASVTDAWNTATDYWVCGVLDQNNQPTVSQAPLSAATPCMISLVSGNVYYQSSTISITTTNIPTASLLGQLKNVPTVLTANGYLETLADIYQSTQLPPAPAQPSLSLPVSFFTALKQSTSTQFPNLYTNGKEYFLQASVTPFVIANNQVGPATTPSVTWFAFNQPNGTADTGIGYYYTIPTDPTVTTIQPGAGMAEFNLQAMRAHYGVSVASNGVQTLVLPMSSLPLPMSSTDQTLAAGAATTSGSTSAPNYMQYLGQLSSVNNTLETDYYYQNVLANNFLMRRVSSNPLSSFAQTIAKTSKTSVLSDYYVDLVSGDEFNLDGSPRLQQVAVAYTSVGSGTTAYLNLTNPLFVWSQYDPITNMPTYAALFQQFDNNGYQVLSPIEYGNSYDIKTGANGTRYSYATVGGNVVVQAAPLTINSQGMIANVGTPTTVTPALDANQQPTGMQTTLATAFSNGSLIAINTTCADGTILTQIPSVPSVYFVTPASGNGPVVFTQALPGVTTTKMPQTANINNNASYLTSTQINTFLAATPFVAVFTGNLAAGTSVGSQATIAAPNTAVSQDYYVCGLMTPGKSLLSVVTSYPQTSATSAGRYYFIASNEDTNAAGTIWNAPQKGQYYPNNYMLLTPLADPTQAPFNLSAPTVNAGIFDYTTIAAATTPVSATATNAPAATASTPTTPTVNALAPTAWGKSASYLVINPEQVGADQISNVSVTGTLPKVFNFVYSSVGRDQLANINNGVQVVTSLQGTSYLAAPLNAGALSNQTVSPANNNVFFSAASGLAQACSLYQVQGTEKDAKGVLASFNQPAPTQPMIAPNTYVDLATGTMYIQVSGTLYPLSYGAPYGTLEFLYPFLNIHGVDSTGKVKNN